MSNSTRGTRGKLQGLNLERAPSGELQGIRCADAWDLWAPMATLRVTRATNGRVRPPQLPTAHPGLVPFPAPPQPKLRRQGRREAPRTSPSRTEQTAPATPDGSDEQAPSPRRRAGRSPPTALASRPANLPRPTRQLAPELLPRTTRDPLRQPQRQDPPKVPARPGRPGPPFSGVPSQRSTARAATDAELTAA